MFDERRMLSNVVIVYYFVCVSHGVHLKSYRFLVSGLLSVSELGDPVNSDHEMTRAGVARPGDHKRSTFTADVVPASSWL